MKLKLKKILTLSIMLLMIGAVRVNAAELSFGESKSGENTIEVPVILKVSEGESITEVKIDCGLVEDIDKVSCSVGKAEANMTSNNGLFVYVSDDNKFPEGNTTITKITLTNENNHYVENVGLKLKNSSINGQAVNLEKKYTRIGAKAAARVQSSNATFDKVSFSSGIMSPNFSPDVFEYTVYKIPDTVNSVVFKYECDGCREEITGAKEVSGTKIILNQGENKIAIKCISEDEQNNKTYTFNLIRGESSFNSAKLAKLSFEGYTLTPKFDPKVTEYTLVVPNRINGLVNEISYEAEDEKATITPSGLDNFQIGEDNKIQIKVDNSQGDESITYTVTVKRLSNTEIQILKYKNKEITFKDSEGTENTLSEAEFKAQYPDEYLKILNNEYKFDKDGNIIFETEKEETDTEEKEEKKNSKTIIIIIIIVVGIIIIGVSGFFIFRKKPTAEDKEEDKNTKDENETKEEKDNKSDNKSDKKVSKKEEEIDETGIEEETIKKEEKVKEDTVDIDEALSDLMSTKRYEFKDED